jgi:hypothetical protein
MDAPEFREFQKIARLSRDVIVTEKIDGTNGLVYVSEDGTHVMAGSRNRWLSPEKSLDNFGFAAWVRDNATELLKLGPGYHYGEWWGAGIGRRYDLTEKRFSLFNPKYCQEAEAARSRDVALYTVPVLYIGPFDTGLIEGLLTALAISGSQAAPGFMKPEGVVIYHTASRSLFKKTIEKDEAPKGLAQ